MSDNPYAPSGSSYGDASLDANFDLSQAELIRKSHLSHEANIQGFGCLYTLGGILGILGAIFYVGIGILVMAGGVVPKGLESMVFGAGGDRLVSGGLTTLVGVVFLAIAVAQLFAGRSMQTLNPSGKILAIVVAAIGMLQFPCGTLISGYLFECLQGGHAGDPAHSLSDIDHRLDLFVHSHRSPFAGRSRSNLWCTLIARPRRGTTEHTEHTEGRPGRTCFLFPCVPSIPW